ncbi:MAG: redoxin domain-containing protein [Acidimicrobiia bacterium]|nr:redoxin domain-containing protein [Acidimicrobiia bacterium]
MTEAPSAEAKAGGRKFRAWMPLAAILVGVAILAFVFNGRFGNDPRLVDSPLIGQPLPELTLDYLEQEGSLTLSDLEGQVLVLNFWASWCFPCRLEHPALTAAAAAYESRGVHFVGILYQDRKGPAVGFLDEFGRGDNYSYVDDPDSRATVELGVFGVPETYFVDAEGIVRGKVQGQITEVVLVNALEAILAGRTPDL